MIHNINVHNDFFSNVLSKLGKLCYTDKLFYYTGTPYVTDLEYLFKQNTRESNEKRLHFVIRNENSEDEDDLTGLFSYTVDMHKNCAYDLSAISFKDSPEVAQHITEETEKLIKTFHRVEWTIIAGCGQEKFCDDFCKKHNGHKIVLHSAVKDQYGEYHDKYIYEIVNK